MPAWPVNHSVPSRVEHRGVEVRAGAVGARQRERPHLSTSSGSTRTMAFSPPSVIQGAPSGPTITPWGREPSPRRDLGDPAGRGVEPAQLARALRGVPDGAVGGDGHVVGSRARGHVVLLHPHRYRRRGRSSCRARGRRARCRAIPIAVATGRTAGQQHPQRQRQLAAGADDHGRGRAGHAVSMPQAALS